MTKSFLLFVISLLGVVGSPKSHLLSSLSSNQKSPSVEKDRNPPTPQKNSGLIYGCSDPNSPNLEICQKLATFAINSELLVSVTNHGNLALWQNWGWSVLRSGVKNFVTFSLDDKVKSKDNELNKHLLPLPSHLRTRLSSLQQQSKENFNSFGNLAYVSFMKIIPDLNKWVMQQNFSILYSDTDIYVVSNPFPVLHELREKNPFAWYASVDRRVTLSDLGACDLKVACGGLFYAKESSFSLSFFDKWIEEVKESPEKMTNQKPYNTALHKEGTQQFGILPCDLFPNGYRFNEAMMGHHWRPLQKRNPVMIHNNWVKGKDIKIQSFKRWGMWKEKMGDADPSEIVLKGRKQNTKHKIK